MPQLKDSARPRACAWSPGAAGPALGGAHLNPGFRPPAPAIPVIYVTKSRDQIRKDVTDAFTRDATIRVITRATGLSRPEVIAIGKTRGLEHDFPTDRMVPAGAASDPVSLLSGSDEETDWQDRAICAQTDPEAFFPEKGGSTREAKKVCRGCEVRAECLEYALEHDIRFGVWGALSERERRRMKREQAAQPGEAAA